MILRWQAIIDVGEYIESGPELIWEFVAHWGTHPQDDLRMAIATCRGRSTCWSTTSI